MRNYLVLIFGIIGALVLYNAIILYTISVISRKIRNKENQVLELFFAKVNKIPAIVEIMRKYTNHPDIFEDIIYLHKMGIVYNITSIYDILDLNHRIHREFQFLMKLSTKIKLLHRDGNFLHIRNYVIFYENHLEKEINIINDLFNSYNKYINLKNLSLLGFIIPLDKKQVI